MIRQANPTTSVDTDRRPFVLVWELTRGCELACKHCRAEATPERDPEELTTAEGIALIDDIHGFGKDQLLVLSGGDPLFRPDTFELIEYAIERGLRVTVTPSGTRSLQPAVVRRLEERGIRRLALSLDGGSALTHDQFRLEVGSFEYTIRAARAAQASDLPLQINTTVCAETIDDLPAVLELVVDLDAVLWSLFFLVPVGRGQALESITPDQAEEVMQWLLEEATTRDIGIKTTEAPHYRRVAIQAAARPTPSRSDDGIGRRLGIGAGNGFAFISHTGEVYPSGFLPVSAGNVRSESVVDIYRDAALFKRLRDPEALQGKCGVCPFKHVCGGSRSRAWATAGEPLASDPLCPYVPPEYAGPLPETQGSHASQQ